MEVSREHFGSLAGQPKDKRRQGYASLDAVDPRDGKVWQVLVSHDKMDWVRAQGRGRLRELAKTVPATLMAPTAIYLGVRAADVRGAEDKNDWLCYAAKPASRFLHNSDAEVPSPPNRVFLVFMTDERVVYAWYWVEADSNDLSQPIGASQRFRRRLL